MSRQVPPPAVLQPWDVWCREAEAAVRDSGGWVGSYRQVMTWAQGKLEVASAHDRAKRTAEGWNSPEGLLARWARLRRIEWVATGDKLVLKSRPTQGRARKATPVPAPSPPLPFE